MKQVFFLLCVFLMYSLVWPVAAQRQDFTLEQVVNPAALAPADLPLLSWVPGTNDFSFLQGPELMRGSAGSGRTKAVLNLGALSSALQKAGGQALASFPLFRWVAPQSFVLQQQNNVFLFEVNNRSATLLHSLDPDARPLDIHPLSLHLAQASGAGLSISLRGGGTVQVSQNGHLHPIEASASDFLSLSPKEPSLWSPSGQLLAYFLREQTAPAALAPAPVRAAVFDTRSRQSVSLQPHPDWPLVARLTWGPDEESVYAVRLNQKQNRLQVAEFEASSGRMVKALFEEESGPFRAPAHGLFFVPRSPRQFVWVSDRNGFDHLYLYDTGGQQLRQLTAGDWNVTQVLGFDQEGQTVFYVSTAESPIERHFYSLNLSNGNTTRISQGTGVHQPQLSPNTNYFLNTSSSFVSARQIRILDLSGKIRHTLLTDRDPLQNYRTGEITLLPIKAEDGTDLYCRLVTPPGFDRSRQYPVVVYLGHHPREQQVLNSWLGGGELWMQWLAQKGYIVFSLDGRGSAHRGRAFGQAPFGKAGILEGQDQLAGVGYLRSLDYVDPARIAVWGHQLNGNLAASLLFNAPSELKAGISVNPTLTWHDYQPLFPVPASAKAKQETDMSVYLTSLKNPLLVAVTEEGKSRNSGGEVAKAAKAHQAPVDLFSYPSAANSSVVLSADLLRKITRFLEEKL